MMGSVGDGDHKSTFSMSQQQQSNYTKVNTLTSSGRASRRAASRHHPYRVKRADATELLLSDMYVLRAHTQSKFHWWPAMKLEGALRLYAKFMVLLSKSKRRLSPPLDVDAIWHEHILDTTSYRTFCTKHFGRMLEHTNRAQDPASGRQKRIPHTVSMLRLALPLPLLPSEEAILSNPDNAPTAIPAAAIPAADSTTDSTADSRYTHTLSIDFE